MLDAPYSAIQREPTAPFFAVSTHKLIIMNICTFGLYEFYWFFRNWKAVRTRTRERLMPYWRAVFWFIFCYPLLKRIKETPGAKKFSAGGATLFCLITYYNYMYVSLSPAYNLISSILVIMPLVYVQRIVNDLNRKVAPSADKNSRLSGWNLVTILIGGLLFIFFTFTDTTKLLENLGIGLF